MPLQVGVIGNYPGWSLLLQQEGIPYSLNVQDGALQKYSIIVLGSEVFSTVNAMVLDYLKGGGAVLCSGKAFQQLTGITTSEKFIRYLVPDSHSEFANTGIVDLYRTCWVHPDTAEMRGDNGNLFVLVGEFGGGHVVVLPFDAGEAVLDDRTATKSFYARRSRLPFEHVSFVSKGTVRQLVSRSLELLHHSRGLPYVHCWYYPNDAQSVFAFRIDTDSAGQEQIQSLYKFLSMRSGDNREQHIPATWFVDVKSQEHWLADYASMHDQEIGVHCYEHKKYKNAEDFSKDVKRAIDALKKIGLRSTCFAAPYGQWSEKIGRAAEALGFDVASEFSYDYDNFPSFPYLGEKFSSVLQIPVHPISMGSLRRQGFGKQEMKDYFQLVLERKLAAREPSFIYHHPRDGNEEVLTSIFEFVRRNDIPIVQMKAFADWWKKRIRVKVQLEVVDSTLKVIADDQAENIQLHITRGDGSEAFTPMNSEIKFSKLNWKPCPLPVPVPSDYARIRKFNPWIWLIRTEDFIYKKLFHSS